WFGDRVHLAMSLAGDALLVVEGRQPDQVNAGTNPNQVQIYGGGTGPRRTRANWASAYYKKNGKVKWYRSASGSDQESKYEIGFLSAPVSYGQLLLVPVSDNGALWLYALAAEESAPGKRDGGRTLWKTYMCDEPAGGCAPWSPVGL